MTPRPVVPGAASFWDFVRLRQEAWFHRASGRPAPYSNDPAIARYHFTNVYRELDRGTEWFHAHRGPGFLSTLAATLVYRPVNRIATFEAFGGRIPADDRRRQKFAQFVTMKMDDGEKVFTGRHQTRGLSNYLRTLADIGTKGAAVAAAIRLSDTMEQVVKSTRMIWGIGDFMSWQVTSDLLEAGHLNDVADAHEWAFLGPGALAGLKLIVDGGEGEPVGGRDGLGVTRANSVTLACQLVADRRNLLKREHVPGHLPNALSLKNIEHALCEYARWVACRNGGTHGLEVKDWAKSSRVAEAA